MHKQLIGLLTSVILLLLQTHLHAQSYRPFIPHLTYLYECHYKGSNNQPDIKGAYALKIDSVYTEGTDSVFRFNQIGRGSVCPYQDNIMGGKMIEKPNGDYQFIANEVDTIVIRTQVPLQSSWAYDSITTATLIARQETDVLGQMDSVLIISLSTGDSLMLSKNFGFVNAQAILPIEEQYYHSNTYVNEMKSPLKLIGIDELGLGQSYFNRRDIYDFAIGDVYLYRRSRSCYSEIFTYIWERVLDRRESLDGDTIYYDYEIEKIGITPHGIGFPMPPDYPGDTTHKGISYHTETIDVSKWVSPPKLLSYEYDIPSDFHLQGPYYTPKWNDRLSYDYTPLGSYEPLTNCHINLTGGLFYTFTEGLGTTVGGFGGPVPIWCKQLLAFQKSTDTAGLWIEPQMLVSNETELGTSTLNLYPNPSDSFVHIEFCTEQAIQDWQLKLIDIHGRVAYQSSGFEANHCLSQELGIEGLAQGIYTLQLISSEGRVLQTNTLSKN